MISYFVIVGKINDIKINKDSTTIVVAIRKCYKNSSGEYDDDLIRVEILKGSNSINEFLNINDVVGVKGRIQSDNVLLAEKVTVVKSDKN